MCVVCERERVMKGDYIQIKRLKGQREGTKEGERERKRERGIERYIERSRDGKQRTVWRGSYVRQLQLLSCYYLKHPHITIIMAFNQM